MVVLYFHLPNYVFAMLFWTLIGRFMFSLFLRARLAQLHLPLVPAADRLVDAAGRVHHAAIVPPEWLQEIPLIA